MKGYIYSAIAIIVAIASLVWLVLYAWPGAFV
jgi:hypothetical protein